MALRRSALHLILLNRAGQEEYRVRHRIFLIKRENASQDGRSLFKFFIHLVERIGKSEWIQLQNFDTSGATIGHGAVTMDGLINRRAGRCLQKCSPILYTGICKQNELKIYNQSIGTQTNNAENDKLV